MTTYQTTMRTVSYVEYFFNDYYDNMDAEKDAGNPRQVNIRDAKLLILPRGCFGFRFFDRYEGVCEGEKVTSGRVNVSETFLIGHMLHRSEVEEYFPEREDILKKMDVAEVNRVVHCSAPHGDIWHLMEDEDEPLTILDPNTVTRS